MKKLAIAIAIALPLPLLAGGCKEDEPPPPLPSAAPEPAAPTQDLTLVVEEPVVDAGADAGPAKKYTGTAKPKGNLANCCAALNQNAANAPEPTATYMKQAAATCSMLVGQGQGEAVIAAAVSAALKGASIPAACQ